MATDIKQIKVGEVLHDIDAKKWGGHTFSEVESLIHGVVDTYVIPAQTTNKTADYKAIVESTSAQVSTTAGKLKGLVSNPPSNGFDSFNVGDVILMGATSDGTNNFDRWISSFSGSGDSATITLDVLETQVAKHHHTVVVPAVTNTSVKVLSTASVGSRTSNNMAYAGSAVTVVTGASNADDVVVTSVAHDAAGGHNMKIETGTSADHGHSHTVNAHNHTVSYDKTTVGSKANAYTSLSTSSYTPHTHTVVSVAGKSESDGTITYVNATPKSTATFIKTLTDASTTTATGGATPGTSAVSLTTTTQASTDTIGDVVKTNGSGGHGHTVTTTTDVSVVTGVSLASKVVTGVAYTAPSVASTVVTAVSLSKSAATTVTSFVASVNSSGVLSFTVTSGDRVSSITFTSSTGSQTAGSCTATSTTQSLTSGKVNTTGTAASVGDHQHGFSHTHAIAAHSHTVNDHTHTYKKTVASTTESAITALSTSTYNAHKHTNISAASISTDSSTPISYVYGGGTTSVVKELTTTSTAATVGDANPGTSTVYQKVTGTITYPGFSLGTKKLSDMLKTTSVKPAVDSGEKPAMSITTSSVSVVGSISVSDSSVNTSSNIGGE